MNLREQFRVKGPYFKFEELNRKIELRQIRDKVKVGV